MARVRRDFAGPVAVEVLQALQDVPEGLAGGSLLDPERIQAALVLTARGDRTRVDARLALARLDWRDALVVGGLADADWSLTLDRELGPPTGDGAGGRRGGRGPGAGAGGPGAGGRGRPAGPGRARRAVGFVLPLLVACSAVGLAIAGEIAVTDGRWVQGVALYGGGALVIGLMVRGRPGRR